MADTLTFFGWLLLVLMAGGAIWGLSGRPRRLWKNDHELPNKAVVRIRIVIGTAFGLWVGVILLLAGWWWSINTGLK